MHIGANSFIMTSSVMAHKLEDGTQDPGGPCFKTRPYSLLHYQGPYAFAALGPTDTKNRERSSPMQE